MSVVAIRKIKDKIIMAADVQWSWGYKKFATTHKEMYAEPAKIWQHNGITVGGAGSVSESMLFRIFTKTHKPASADVPGILDYLVEFCDWAKKKQTDFKLDNHYLIVFEKKMFQAISYDVQEITEYNAVGSGMFLALGAMYKGSDPVEAVDVAKTFDLFCGGETDVIEV